MCRRALRSGSTWSCRYREAKGLKKADDPWAPDKLDDLGRQGWEAVGLSLKYGDFMAWPVVLLKRPLD